MIVETFTREEMSEKIREFYGNLDRRLIAEAKPFYKDFLKRRRRIVYSKTVKLNYMGNTYVALLLEA